MIQKENKESICIDETLEETLVEENITSIDMKPHFIKALVHKEKLYPDIDTVYEKNKFKYYQAAKKSPLYNHGIARATVLKKEQYFRKVAGIFICATEGDKDAEQAILELFKKGYRRVYNVVKNETETSFYEFIKIIKNNYKDLSLEDYDSLMYAFFYFTMVLEIEITDMDDKIKAILENMEDYYSESSKKRINLEVQKKEYPDLYKAVIQDRKILNKNSYFMNCLDKESPYGYLFDLEEVSITDIMNEVRFEQKELDEISLAYEISKTRNYDIDFEEYVVPALFIRAICQEYKKTKELYFKDNQENIQLQLYEEKRKHEAVVAEKEQENLKLRNSLELLQREKEEMLQQIEQIKKDQDRVVARKDLEEKEREELFSLREFAYQQMEKDADPIIENQIPYEALKETRCVVIGGHDNWTAKMKKCLPNWTFISPNSSYFDANLLQNADHVFIFADYCNHPLYHRAISSMPNRKRSFSYLSSVNVEKSLRTIAEVLEVQ